MHKGGISKRRLGLILPSVSEEGREKAISRSFDHHISISDCETFSNIKKNMLPAGKFKVSIGPKRRKI